MLTRTQIETATTAELEKLARRLSAELEHRREEEEHSEALKSQDTLSGTYRWEMVECGHKDRCKRCKSGRKHGPYLYRYYYRDGKQRSEYVALAKARALGFERPPLDLGR